MIDDEQIKSMSKLKYKTYINETVDRFAFNKLLLSAKSQSKCQLMIRNLDPNNLTIQKYLVSEDFVKEDQVLLFSLRSFTYPVKSNYHYLFKDNMICLACMKEETIKKYKSHM